jgi:hypothetical protein
MERAFAWALGDEVWEFSEQIAAAIETEEEDARSNRPRDEQL